METYASSQNAGNVELFLSLWDENTIGMRPDTPPFVGIKAMEQRVRPRFQTNRFTTMLKIEEAVAAGDWGYARGLYTQTLTPKDGGALTFVDGRFLTILEKQTDGSWKIYRDMTSSNVPPR